jgi:predicted transcriptional regulator
LDYCRKRSVACEMIFMYEEQEVCDVLINSALTSNESFIGSLKSIMRQQGVSMKDLSDGSGIPLSTLNKVISQERDLRLSTLRQIIQFFQPKAGVKEGDLVVGLIAARSSLDKFSRHNLEFNGKKVAIKEYPASDIEGAIISAIKAERDEVDGLICASIVASIIEKFVTIPMMTIKIEESNIVDSLSVLIEKITSKSR